MNMDFESIAHKFMSLKDVCAYLGLSKETIYRRIYDGSIPKHKVGKLWKFKKREIDCWVKSHKGKVLKKPGRKPIDVLPKLDNAKGEKVSAY